MRYPLWQGLHSGKNQALPSLRPNIKCNMFVQTPWACKTFPSPNAFFGGCLYSWSTVVRGGITRGHLRTAAFCHAEQRGLLLVFGVLLSETAHTSMSSLTACPSSCGEEVCLVPSTPMLQRPSVSLRSLKLFSGCACSRLGLLQASGMKRGILPAKAHALSSQGELSVPGVVVAWYSVASYSRFSSHIPVTVCVTL